MFALLLPPRRPGVVCGRGRLGEPRPVPLNLGTSQGPARLGAHGDRLGLQWGDSGQEEGGSSGQTRCTRCESPASSPSADAP